MDDISEVPAESNASDPRQEVEGYFDVPIVRANESLLLNVPDERAVLESPKQTNIYDKADLDEYCLWLYSIYERLDIESNKRT